MCVCASVFVYAYTSTNHDVFIADFVFVRFIRGS